MSATEELPWPDELAAFRESLQALRTPGIGLYVDEGAGASFLGGVPEVPAGFAWPSVDDRPMAFLAQLDLAELHAARPLPWLPVSGRLLFFYDLVEECWGYEPGHSRYWRVLWIPEGAAVHETSAPQAPTRHFMATTFTGSELIETPASEIVEITFPRVVLAPRPVDTFPAYDDPLLMLEVFDAEPDEDEDGGETAIAEAYRRMRYDRLPTPQHQVGGMPVTLQRGRIDIEAQILDQGLSIDEYDALSAEERVPLVAGFEDWELLLQLDSDDDIGWMWGDCGLLYFLVRGQDAKRGDFSRVRVILQCF